MVVNAAELADFPANGHTLEDLVLEDEIARVAALREEKIFLEGFRTDGMVDDVVLNVFEREIGFPDGGEVFDPVRDGELLDGDLFGHEMPPKKKV